MKVSLKLAVFWFLSFFLFWQKLNENKHLVPHWDSDLFFSSSPSPIISAIQRRFIYWQKVKWWFKSVERNSGHLEICGAKKKKKTVILLFICVNKMNYSVRMMLKSLSLIMEGFTYEAQGEVGLHVWLCKESKWSHQIKLRHHDKSHDQKCIKSNKIRAMVYSRQDTSSHTILPQLMVFSFTMCLTLQLYVSPLWGLKETLLVRWNFQPCSKARSVCLAFSISTPFLSSLISMSGGWKSLTWQISVLSLPNSPGLRLYTWIFGGARDKDA